MRTRIRSVILWSMIMIILIAGRGEADIWITVDPPGATSTEAFGVDGNHIVGEYSDGSHSHGFVWDGATNWTKLDYTGAIHTNARDIDSGLIIGGYYDGSSWHSYIYNGTNWTKLSYDGSNETSALGIDNGNIVGYYNMNGRHGFLYHGGTWTTLDYSGGNRTELRGIDGSRIVGTYDFYRGLVYDRTTETWTLLDFGGASRTVATGIDGSHIVGYYRESDSSENRGFLYDEVTETWTLLDFPGALSTSVHGIDGRKMVGRYRDVSGKYHGFLYILNDSPVAICQDVLAAVGVDGYADASIDGGSYDPDGDDIEFSQNPTGPYPVGVYNVELTVTDPYGASDNCQAMLVVYDPSGGFVTGGGWIWSPKGAYIADPWLEGKANFGFVSKYKKGVNVPTGQTEFVFQAGDLNFHSSSYDWLVVTGSDYARFKGTGTINGSGEYKFMLWAGDDDPDTFRIKIWWEEGETENVVYDNGMDQAIGGGSIVIHTK